MPLEAIEETTRARLHQPPGRWGSPNGDFPLSDGDWAVTETNGDRVDGFDLATGRWTARRAPGPAVVN